MAALDTFFHGLMKRNALYVAFVFGGALASERVRATVRVLVA